MKRLLKWLLAAFRPSTWTVRDVTPPPIVEKADDMLREVRLAQQRAEVENAAKRHQERMAKYSDWVRPEEIEKRRRAHEEAAAAALEKARVMSRHAREALGMPLEDPPLPPEDQLPKEMRGQPASTVRAMLRQQSWTYDGSGWKPPKPKFKVSEGAGAVLPTETGWRFHRGK